MFLFFPRVDGQQTSVHFERIRQDQDLPSQYISDFFQDSKGFLWIGTNSGLARYDGYTLQTYQRSYGGSQSLLYNIWSIYEDKNGIIWLGGSEGISQYDRKTGKFSLFPTQGGGLKSPSSGYIGSIREDDAGRLWVSCTQDSFNLFDPKTATFQRYLFDLNNFPWVSFSAIEKDNQQPNTFWIGGSKGSLIQFNTESKKFKVFSLEKHISWLFLDVCQLRNGALWLGGHQGIWYFDKKKQQILPLETWPSLRALSDLKVTNILEDSRGTIWIGTTAAGLFELNPATGNLIQHLHDPDNPKSLISNDISILFEDRSGIVWVGTREGLNFIARENSPFKQFRLTPHKPTSRQPRININAIHEDKDGLLWVGTEFYGLYKINRKTAISEYLTIPPYQHENFAYTFCETQNGDLWMGMNGQGPIHYDKKKNAFRRIEHDPSTPIGTGNNYVKAILEDRNGKLWMATFGGLTRFDPITGAFKFYGTNGEPPANLPNPGNLLTDACITRKGLIWITSDKGIHVFDPSREVFQSLLLPPQRNPKNNDEIFIFEDSKGLIWTGGYSGLIRIEPSGDAVPNLKIKTTFYTEKDGIAGTNIYGILEDRQGQIWLPTHKGITVFKNPHELKDIPPVFKNYNTRNDLQCPPLVSGAFHQSRSGELFFGTANGILYFHPDSIQNDAYQSPLVITRFSFFDATQPDQGIAEEPGISGMNEITLSYRNNIFSVEFAAIDFRDPSKIRYAYQMTGFNDNWIDLNNRRQVTFTNLDPGTYIFRVKGTNSDGVWNKTPTVLKVTILPPWWRTWWAYTAYLILFVAALYGWVKMRTRSLETRARELELAVVKGTAQIMQQKEQLELQAGQLQELDRMKSNFYTNITHEFRTPLTVILGMADQLETYFKALASEQFNKGVELIRRNGKSLLKLINELLDLSKLDSGAMELQLVQDNVVRFISYVLESFQSLAESKQIRLFFQSEDPGIEMDFDQDKLQRVIANLVSNAIKFTPVGGTVSVSLSKATTQSGAENLLIRVRDTGIGISPEQLPYVFDRFYQATSGAEVTPFQKGVSSKQVEAGSGIGLALSRELIHLMQGTIALASTPGQGSEFTVMLPIHRTAQPAVAAPELAGWVQNPDLPGETAESGFYPEKQHGERPLLLLAEDNADVAFYLQTCVADDYETILARNGREGIELALDRIPDLIISDVMMPEKDGFELCETLKNDARTSHIPIVLLTAKADVASRIEGLTRGADVYLAKPFDKKELLVQLQRLLHSRQLLQARFTTTSPPPSDDPGIVIEDRFLTNIRAIVSARMEEDTFGIEALAAAVFLSSSQLFRKIKALTGQSPALYLRSLRLQKAMELLKNAELSVSEVAYQVGFSDPAYFSRTFTQEFGFPPSSVRKGS